MSMQGDLAGSPPERPAYFFLCETCGATSDAIVHFRLGDTTWKSCVHCYNAMLTDIDIVSNAKPVPSEDYYPRHQFNRGEFPFSHLFRRVKDWWQSAPVVLWRYRYRLRRNQLHVNPSGW